MQIQAQKMLIIFSVILVICLYNDGGVGGRKWDSVQLHTTGRSEGKIMQIFLFYSGLCYLLLLLIPGYKKSNLKFKKCFFLLTLTDKTNKYSWI